MRMLILKTTAVTYRVLILTASLLLYYTAAIFLNYNPM